MGIGIGGVVEIDKAALDKWLLGPLDSPEKPSIGEDSDYIKWANELTYNDILKALDWDAEDYNMYCWNRYLNVDNEESLNTLTNDEADKLELYWYEYIKEAE